MAVSHDGGIFRTKTLAENSQDFKSLAEINQQVLSKFGIVHGATHSEFIKSNEDGKFYFLETSSRVGGAHIRIWWKHLPISIFGGNGQN